MPRLVRALGACVAVLVVGALPSLAAAERPAERPAEQLVLAHPVDAPVVDHFRPPATPYGPGNRGLEYRTVPGSPVGAAGDGEVVFAGQVAGSLHVTVRHLDGVVSTASFLASISVAVGDRVRLGDPVGTAAAMLHVGVRIDGEYVDPAVWFGRVRVVVRLVPEGPAGGGVGRDPVPEWAHLALLARSQGPGGPGALDRLLGATTSVGRGLVGNVDVLAQLATGAFTIGLGPMGPGGPLGLGAMGPWPLESLVERGHLVLHQLVELQPTTRLVRTADRLVHWIEHRLECTDPGHRTAPVGERRLAVLVGGLGSSSDRAAIGEVDVDRLGYARGDVIGFSYAGGRTPTPFCPDDPRPPAPDLAGLDVRDYDAGHSSTDLRGRGVALADLLAEVAGSTEEIPVDVYAHSQGGVVLRLALAELDRRPGGGAVIDRLGLLATMGTPHGGADAATVAVRLGGAPLGALALAGAEALSGRPLHPHHTTVADLGRTSPVVRELSVSPVPAGPTVLSIGARGDLVVPAARTRLAGAGHATVSLAGPRAHDRLPGDEAVTRELALALAGHPPTCRSFIDTGLDIGVSELVDAATDHVGLVVTAALGA